MSVIGSYSGDPDNLKIQGGKQCPQCHRIISYFPFIRKENGYTVNGCGQCKKLVKVYPDGRMESYNG